MTQEAVPPKHGDHPNDQYTYEGCPGCHPPLDLRRALDLPTTDAGERLHRLIDGPQYSGPAGRSYIREMGKRIADVEREARAEAEAHLKAAHERLGTARAQAVVLREALQGATQVHACLCGSDAHFIYEHEGNAAIHTPALDREFAVLLRRHLANQHRVLKDTEAAAHDHDARIARPWREAAKEAVEKHSLHSGLCSCIDPFVALLATESTQQEDRT